MGGRLARMREMRAEIARLKAENSKLSDENRAWRHHYRIAAMIAESLRQMPAGGVLRLIDGWNLVLGAQRIAASREELLARVRTELAAAPQDRAWVVFDGPRASCRDEGPLRIMYTGGEGDQRADRLLLDLLRMAALACGAAAVERIRIETTDKRLALAAARIAEANPRRGTDGEDDRWAILP